MLTLSGIGKIYGSRLILKKVSLHIAPATISLLVGANGAGKSTLLRIMAGLTRPDSGSVHRACEEGELAYLGHETFQYPGLTARENLMFWGRLYHQRPDAAQIRDLLARVGLLRFAEERAGGFSRGMAQRLNLARVLLQEPRCLLLDEPGTGLDAPSRELLHQEITAARARGAAVVWISHDVHTDARMADRLLAIADRTLAFDGLPSDYLTAIMTDSPLPRLSEDTILEHA